MHRILAAGLLLGCANAPPRPLPKAQWTQGQAAYLRWVGEELTANPGRTGYLVDVREAIAQDLRDAGFRILVQPEGAGELIVEMAMTDSAFPQWAVRLACGERTVDGFVISAHDLACARWSVEPRCIGREVAARILESKEVRNALFAP